MPITRHAYFFCFLLPALLPLGSFAAESADMQTLKAMDIEGLLELEVTSVSKKAQKLWGTAAAIHVIDQEDIRRSGATHLPELLRLAPGVQVSQINANSWAISIRGFNGRFSNKLLVLMDGRSLYTPLYSGVYWDSQDTLLSDIERIEVIRGPGATVWGANAVNGVINIITKSARETTGGYLEARAGSDERAAGIRQGGPIGDHSDYRVYAKSFRQDAGAGYLGESAHDAWDSHQVGFRLDSEVTPLDTLRLQGDLYRGTSQQTLALQSGNRPDQAERSGGNLLLSWSRLLGEESGIHMQFFYDHTERRDRVTAETRNTLDLDFNHYFRPHARHQVNWGLGYRRSGDHQENPAGSSVTVSPTRRTSQTWSGFLQDEISLIEDRLSTTWGAKIEHNSYTGLEFQPSARISWTPDSSFTLWGAVSAAMRTPSRIESDFTLLIPGAPSGYALLGNPALHSEQVTSFELGLRKRLDSGMTLDSALFYNRHKDLRSIEFEATSAAGLAPYSLPASSPLWVVNRIGNGVYGDTYGMELSLDWQASDDWRLKAGYSWLGYDLKLRPWSSDTRSLAIAGYSPEHQLSLQSQWDLARNLEFDATLHYTGKLESLAVPAHTRIDLRLAWFPQPELETSLVLHNLLDDRHPEFTANEGLATSEQARRLYAQVRWNF